MKEDYEIIADWIANESNDTRDEIEWLLLELYSDKNKNIKDDFEDILELGKEKQERLDKAVESVNNRRMERRR